MLRRALTYQLILAVAVGPLLCCCSAGKSLADAPATGAQSPTHAPVTAERISHSCCSHKPDPAKPDSGPKPAPAKPDRPSEKCPCKDGAGKPQVTQAEPIQTDLSTFLRALAFDVTVPFASFVATVVVPEVAGLAAGRSLDDIPSPTDELLYAHHKLRC